MINPSHDAPPVLHPLPPEDLEERELPIKLIPAGKILYRVHRAIHDPVYFGNSMGNRFDVDSGIIYLGLDEYVVFIETIGRFPDYRIISESDLNQRRVTEIFIQRDLYVVDFTGGGLARLSADSRLFSGYYYISQQWSENLLNHPSKPDGILYRSRHDPSRYCLGLYQARLYENETNAELQQELTYEFLSSEFIEILVGILDEYDFGLDLD